MTEPSIFYFGCWNTPGHFMHLPGGKVLYDNRTNFLDGGYPPKINPQTRLIDYSVSSADPADFSQAFYGWKELPQGKFLRHELPSGHSIISWWDRCQGDARGGCNSTFGMLGSHTSEALLAGLREHFPHVAANLAKGGVVLEEVQIGAKP